MAVGAVVQFTPEAIRRAKGLLSEHGQPAAGIRLGVRGGGCSGLAYFFEIEGEEKAGDRVLEFEGLRVFLDPKSQLFLSGTEVGWSDSLMQSGFTFQNPNSKRSCSCGESFTV